MIADALELLPSQMALSRDRTVFYDPATQRSRHLIRITLMERQLVGNLLTLLLDSGVFCSTMVREAYFLIEGH